MSQTRDAKEDGIAALMEGFEPDLFITDPDIMASFSRDRTKGYYGVPLAIARPRSAQELSDVIVRCGALDIGVVPQGGLTGLVGAAVSDPDRPELVIQLDRMTGIRSIDTVGFSMVVEAGCILETAKNVAEEEDCLLPITHGAQGSCRIGGTVSTNGGGFNVLRYGMTRDLVLGLEVVLPDGRIWNGLKTLRKDNRGYDLKQLFIGAEGTLGIVTAAAIKLFPMPTQVETALIGLNSIEDAMTLYAKARRSCSDLLSAFEIMLRPGLDAALAYRPELSDPMDSPCPVYILMEVSGGGDLDLRALIEGCLMAGEDVIADGIIAMSKAQADKLWSVRETIVEAQSRYGPYYRTDVSVAIPDIPAFLKAALESLEQDLPEGRPVAYGHVGDGNIHLNVVPPEDYDTDQRKALFAKAQDIIFNVVDDFNGSISAEHGIGRSKKDAFLRRVDPVTLDLFQKLKHTLDPDNILCRGRIFDA